MSKQCILVLDNLRSVENTGSIFRTAEGLGVERLVLVGTTPTPMDRFGRKRQDFTKVSLGTEGMVEWEHKKSMTLEIRKLKSQGYKIIALEQHPSAVHLTPSPLSLSRRGGKGERLFVLIVGNEVNGVSKATLELADEIVEIPMRGKKESLNVSVAAGIALFKLLE